MPDTTPPYQGIEYDAMTDPDYFLIPMKQNDH